jgi:excinuclease ABC subunit C
LEEILHLSILHPLKGDKKAIVELAQKNADELFQQEKDENDLTEKMLLDLQERLKLLRFPERIECFDTSNISGSDMVASMVAFTHGKYDRKRGRLFKIRDLPKGDDYAALRQVIFRRLKRAKEENDLPDLIIVDGGKGQLSQAIEILRELDIATVDVMSVAKQEGKHEKGLTQEKLFRPGQIDPIILPLHSPLLFLLQRIRDEAHRRAIGFHRKKRAQRILTSLIDEIPGIGPVKRQRLLTHFGSLQHVLRASNEALQQVKGITAKEIAQIRQFSRDKGL